MDLHARADQLIAGLLVLPGAQTSRAEAHKLALQYISREGDPNCDLTTWDGQLYLRQLMICALAEDDAWAHVELTRLLDDERWGEQPTDDDTWNSYDEDLLQRGVSASKQLALCHRINGAGEQRTI